MTTSKLSLPDMYRARPLLFTLAICLLLLLLLGGHDGLSLMSHSWVTRAHGVAASLNTPSLDALSKTLDSAHPHLDLLAALWLRLLPLQDAPRSLHIFSISSALLCATCLWRITMRITRRDLLASTIATLHLFLLPALVTQLRIPSATMLTMALWLGLWDLCTLPRRRWWQMLVAWILGGLLLGSWSPMLLWACALILAHLVARPRDEASAGVIPPGVILPSSIPAFVLLCVPLVPLFMVITHPGLWVDVKAGVLQGLESAWLDYPLSREGISLGGRWYEQGKISALQSMGLLLRELPLSSLLLMVAGAFFLRASRAEQDHDARLNQRLLLHTLAIAPLILWAMPGQSYYGSISQAALLLPVCSMLVGGGVVWLGRRIGQARQGTFIAPALLVASALLMPCIATITTHTTPSIWQNSLSGGAMGALEDGDTHHLDAVISEDLVRGALMERPEVETLHVGDLRPLFDWYSLPEGVSLTEDRASADAILWLSPRFTANDPDRPELTLAPGSQVEPLGKRSAPLLILVTSQLKTP